MSRFTKAVIGFILLGLVLGIVDWLILQRLRSGHGAGETPPRIVIPPAAPHPPLPGEPILQNYASPGSRPQEDLSMMAHAFSNLCLLIKGEPLRLSANEEFAAALRGENRARLRFLPDTHPAFNGRHQVIDRWQTPLFFHTLSHDRIDIRSAGPDRQMWTDDDIHRRHDGRFLTGGDLNAASLYDQDVPDQAGRRGP